MSALSLVATPIGNLSDVSDRARAVLAAADVIYAEDTRHSGRLLKHLGVDARLRSCHDHNERQRAVEIVDDLRAGRSVALVSDAGTPGIADPGHVVARSVIDAGFDVTMIPGPSAVVMAVVLSGFATDRFVFDGWLPRRSGGLRRRIEELAAEPRTVVVLESNHRLPKSLPVFAEVVGDPLGTDYDVLVHRTGVGAPGVNVSGSEQSLATSHSYQRELPISDSRSLSVRVYLYNGGSNPAIVSGRGDTRRYLP